MGEKEHLEPSEKDRLREILGHDLLEYALAAKVLPEVMRIAELGCVSDIDPAEVKKAIRIFLCSPNNKKAFHRAGRRIMQKSLDLPPDFVDLENTTVDELFGLAEKGQMLGDHNFDVLRSPENLAAIRARGVADAEQAVLAPFVSRATGIPVDIAKSQPIKTSLQGVEFIQATGVEVAVKNPEFWSDWGGWGQGQKQKLMEKWDKRQKEADARVSARHDREFKKDIKQVQKVWLEWEFEEYREKRRQRERARKLLKKKKKKRKRVPPRRSRSAAGKGAVMHGVAWIDHVVRVLGHEGEYYILRIYPDNTKELYLIENDAIHLVAERYKWSVPVYKKGRFPVIRLAFPEARRVSPTDRPPTPRGPVGTKP